VGLGIKAMYGMLKADTAIDRSPFGFTDRADGQYKYRDNTWGYGANVGVIYAPQPGTRIGHIAVEVDTTAIGAQSKTVDAGFKDTWHLSLGAQYQATEQWLWNFGVAYDSSSVSDSNRSVVVPMNESWRIATGATYALNKDTDVNFDVL
jgi:long-subunit fatty acid transport protein